MRHRPPRGRWILHVCLWTAVGACTGCNVARWLSTPLWPEDEKIQVEAQYRGLDGKSVAVMVAANDHVLFRHPTATLDVCRAVTARLVKEMNTVTVVDPQQVIGYQNSNPHWDRVPYGKLIDAMGVERIVFIELDDYQTNEPGNPHLWHGRISGHVGVIAHDASDPDQFVFYAPVTAEFPEQSTVGVVNTDAERIRLGLRTNFSRDAAGLFYDHEVIKPKTSVVN